MKHISRRTLVGVGASVAALGAFGYATWPKMDGYSEKVAQQRQLLSSNPELEDVARLATLAANSHNTQPWKFRIEGRTVSILPDLARRTGVVDPDDHHLYVSLGCAAENFVIAAAATGWATELVIAGGRKPPINMALSPTVPAHSALNSAIPFRQSTRSLYDGQPISPEDIRLLEAAAQQEGVAVRFFTQDADRDAIIDFVLAGNSAQMDDPAFVEELRGWIRFSPAQAIETGDGLFAACSGNPVTPDWLGRRMFNTFFNKRSENQKYADHIRSSAGVAVFIGDRDDPEHWIKVGRSFQRFALQATALGIRNAHVNQPVEVASVRQEFAHWLEQPDARPDLVIRFGRAPLMPMSLRRPVGEILA